MCKYLSALEMDVVEAEPGCFSRLEGQLGTSTRRLRNSRLADLRHSLLIAPRLRNLLDHFPLANNRIETAALEIHLAHQNDGSNAGRLTLTLTQTCTSHGINA